MLHRHLLAAATLALALAPAAGLSGCAGDIGLDDGVTRTTVFVHDDGTVDVDSETVSLDEQAAEHEADLAAAANPGARIITRDKACDWSSVKLYSQPYYTGDYVCLKGDGYVSLATLCRGPFKLVYGGGAPACSAYWAGNVRSMWSGLNTGFFIGSGASDCWNDGYIDYGNGIGETTGGGPTASASFPLTEAYGTVTACKAYATGLYMNTPLL